MEVCVGTIAMPLVCLRHVVVDDNVDALNVNAAAHKISGHQDALLSLLERLVHLQSAKRPRNVKQQRQGTSAVLCSPHEGLAMPNGMPEVDMRQRVHLVSHSNARHGPASQGMEA